MQTQKFLRSLKFGAILRRMKTIGPRTTILAFVLPIALTMGLLTPGAQSATPKFDLTISAFGLSKNSSTKIKVTGPESFSKVLTIKKGFKKKVILKQINQGKYQIRATPVKSFGKTVAPTTTVSKVNLTKNTNLPITFGKNYIRLKTKNVKIIKLGKNYKRKRASASALSNRAIATSTLLSNSPDEAAVNLEAILKSGEVATAFTRFIGEGAYDAGIWEDIVRQQDSVVSDMRYVGENFLSVVFKRQPRLFQGSPTCNVAIFDLVSGLPSCVVYDDSKYDDTNGETNFVSGSWINRVETTASGYLTFEKCAREKSGIYSDENCTVFSFDISNLETTRLADLKAPAKSKSFTYNNRLKNCLLYELIEDNSRTFAEVQEYCASEAGVAEHAIVQNVVVPEFNCRVSNQNVCRKSFWIPSRHGGMYLFDSDRNGAAILRILPNGQSIEVAAAPQVITDGWGQVFMEEFSDGNLYFGFQAIELDPGSNELIPDPDVFTEDQLQSVAITSLGGIYETILPEIKVYNPMNDEVLENPWLGFSEYSTFDFRELCTQGPDQLLYCASPFNMNAASRLQTGLQAEPIDNEGSTILKPWSFHPKPARSQKFRSPKVYASFNFQSSSQDTPVRPGYSLNEFQIFKMGKDDSCKLLLIYPEVRLINFCDTESVQFVGDNQVMDDARINFASIVNGEIHALLSNSIIGQNGDYQLVRFDPDTNSAEVLLTEVTHRISAIAVDIFSGQLLFTRFSMDENNSSTNWNVYVHEFISESAWIRQSKSPEFVFDLETEIVFPAISPINTN